MTRSEKALKILHEGTVIPANPLALDENRKFDEHRQRALVRYYLDSGVGGLAVAVHTTQFEIRDPKYNLLERVLKVAIEEASAYEKKTGKTACPTPAGPMQNGGPLSMRHAALAAGLGDGVHVAVGLQGLHIDGALAGIDLEAAAGADAAADVGQQLVLKALAVQSLQHHLAQLQQQDLPGRCVVFKIRHVNDLRIVVFRISYPLL